MKTTLRKFSLVVVLFIAASSVLAGYLISQEKTPKPLVIGIVLKK